jgi:hypothetical protein
MDSTMLHELYLKKSENLTSPTVDLEWLNEKLEKKELLCLEESISSCLIQNHEKLFQTGFYCAIDLMQSLRKNRV